jgi:putative SOS response-associated peptidase YedK
MCFHSKLTHPLSEIIEKFSIQSVDFDPAEFNPGNFNAFEFPKMPAICNDKVSRLSLLNWGLIPAWSKDTEIRKYTLNARMETINEKPAFRNYTAQRCIIPVDGFYEWKWLDDKGRMKEKYLLQINNGALFSLGGLWSEFTNKQTGEIIRTFTVLTMPANELMAEIHNTKRRMPLVFIPQNAQSWLKGLECQPDNHLLTGIKF